MRAPRTWDRAEAVKEEVRENLPPKGAPEKDYSYEYDEEDEEEEETSDDDPVELPSLTSLPACCSCPRRGRRSSARSQDPQRMGSLPDPTLRATSWACALTHKDGAPSGPTRTAL